MKFFKKYKMDHGGVLHDGDNITNMPELEKLKTSVKMHKGVASTLPLTHPKR